MSDAPIGVFDSGVGGISTLRSCLDLLPSESYVYLADRTGLPYGGKSAEEITARVHACVDALVGEGVKAIVAACNTATNAGISALRKDYRLPFVGLEPALKPAVEACKKGNVLLLLTPATQKQEKFQRLLEAHDNGRVLVAPQPDLASEVERNIENIEAVRGKVYSVLSRYGNVEGVVLGCTHYVFLRPLIEQFYGGRIKIFDGNDGAARRLKCVLKSGGLISEGGRRSIKFLVI